MINRREFINNSTFQIIKWSPWLGILGLQFHKYTFGPAAGYIGWITFFGKTIGFVPQ